MSLKITVNNEEVVCNSNLQIKEEMLSTSSTILKNCYPKSWELDKDYVSRYYFPKDYSKCKITDDVYHPEVIGTRVSGTNFTINYDNTLNWNLEELKGNTLQDGTPTPDTPIEIQSVTGLQNVNVCGKNLFDTSNAESRTHNGITFTLNNDGSITANGTATSLAFMLVLSQALSPLYKAGNYAFSLVNEMPNNCYVRFEFFDSNNTMILRKDITKNGTATLLQNCYLKVSYVIASGTVLNNFVNYIQIEKGSTATEYEPYSGNTYEVNLGKNLLDKNLLPSTWSSQVVNMITLNVEPNTKYTMSSNIPYGGTVANLFLYDESGTGSTATNGVKDGKNVTVTSSSTGIIKVGYRSNLGTTVTRDDYWYQIEKGSTATSYSPYFTPIELNKIGTYQDSIKKSTGKNLFDKSTIIEGKYIDGNGNVQADTNNFIGDYIEIDNTKTYYVSSNYSTAKRVVYYNSSKTFISREVLGVRSSVLTIPNNAKYIVLSCYNEHLDTLQLEQNSTATSYEPYGKVWYIEKQVSVRTLNGTENWSYSSNKRTYWLELSDIKVQNIQSNMMDIASNLTNYGTILNNDSALSIEYGFFVNNQYIHIRNKNILNNVNSFKTWLASNQVKVLIPLKETTTTEITDETLLSQLENIYNMSLLNGINNIIITSENLPMIMQLYYNYKEAYTSEDLLFCGCVKNTGNISLNPRDPHYVDLQLLDFKCLLSEGETLNYVITGKTIAEAINQVVASISDYGFVVGNIQLLNSNEMIGAYSTLNKTPYDVFQYFADITQSRWTTRMIDENTIAIDFYDPTLLPTAVPIQSTQSYYENNKIVDISFNYSTNDYRNKQIMTSDEVYGNITQTETLIADGYSKTFMCQNKIGTITGITLNGASATFITKSEEQLGESADFVYQPGENTFKSSNTISSGSTIVITYYPIVKGREIILNSTESSRIATQIGRKGTISRYENRNDTTSSQELQKIGQSYIKYKGQAEIVLKVVSENNIFNVGQIVEYQAPLEDLSTEYMVKSKEINWYINADKTFYTYELTSNFNYENAINYFDNQRAKNQGNIGEGEVISRAIDLENTANVIFYDTDIEEIEVQNPTSLDFALDGVLI